MKEESIEFSSSSKVFYNPNMKFCRSFFSLAVGSINEDLHILDAFSATGIRGIRYKKENKNVTSINFLDYSKNAIQLIKKNTKKNKIKAKIHCEEFGRYLLNQKKPQFNFIEIDPFGTPVPYLHDAMRSLSRQKTSYLSVTATDTAVLCGSSKKACIRNYHSNSLNNEFTHENGLRILIKRIIESASEFNLAVTPLVSLSDRHYLKTLVKLEKNAKKSDLNIEQFGYINFCFKCHHRSAGEFVSICSCGEKFVHGGPQWLGELHDLGFLNTMKTLNKMKNYSDHEEIEKALNLMIGEIGMPPFFYNIHILSQLLGLKAVPKTDVILKKVDGVKTHFNKLGFKTKKPFEDVIKAVILA